MISETQMDNILIRQKDKILQMVNRDEYVRAISMLTLVSELWEKVGYGYKRREILNRIAEQKANQRRDEQYAKK